MVLADEAYLRESILSSEARIVSGYQPKTWRCWPATFGRWRFWRPAASVDAPSYSTWVRIQSAATEKETWPPSSRVRS